MCRRGAEAVHEVAQLAVDVMFSFPAVVPVPVVEVEQVVLCSEGRSEV